MRDWREGLQRFVPDLLRRRIGRRELRETRFKRDKFLVESIVFPIADCRRGFLVIVAVVLFDFAAQLGDTFCRLRFIHSHVG